jgi:hypothetical protein
MIFRYIKRKFMPRRTDEAHRPVHRVWIGTQDEAALIDIASGKVLARIWHDGCMKYYPTVYVSPIHALRLKISRQAYLVSLLCLPRCEMEIVRLRTMEDAQDAIEFALAGGR